MSKSISWRVAMRMAEKMEKEQQRKFGEIEDLLGSQLSEIQVEKVNPDNKPFFSSRMRVRAALADATSSDIRRVKHVIDEMLDVIEQEEQRRENRRRAEQTMRKLYREHGQAFDSFEEFLAALAEAEKKA